MAWNCYSCGNQNANSDDVCTKCGGTVAAPKKFAVHWVFGATIFFFLFYLIGIASSSVAITTIAAPSEATVLKEANKLKFNQDIEERHNMLTDRDAKTKKHELIAATKKANELKLDKQKIEELKAAELKALELKSSGQNDEAKTVAESILLLKTAIEQRASKRLEQERVAAELKASKLKAQKSQPSDADLAKKNAYDNILNVSPNHLTAAKAISTQKSLAEISSIVKGLIQWSIPALLFIVCGLIVGFISDGKTIIEAGIGAVLGQSMAVALHVLVFKTDMTWMAFVIGALPGFALGFLGAWLGEIIQVRKELAGGITAS